MGTAVQYRDGRLKVKSCNTQELTQCEKSKANTFVWLSRRNIRFCLMAVCRLMSNLKHLGGRVWNGFIFFMTGSNGGVM